MDFVVGWFCVSFGFELKWSWRVNDIVECGNVVVYGVDEFYVLGFFNDIFD